MFKIFCFLSSMLETVNPCCSLVSLLNRRSGVDWKSQTVIQADVVSDDQSRDSIYCVLKISHTGYLN